MLQLLHGVGRFPAGKQRARKVVHRVVLVVIVPAQAGCFKHRVVVVDEVEKIFRIGGKLAFRFQLQIVFQAVRRAVIVLQSKIVASKAKMALRGRILLIRKEAEQDAVALLKALHLAEDFGKRNRDLRVLRRALVCLAVFSNRRD